MYITRSVLLPCWCEHLVPYVWETLIATYESAIMLKCSTLSPQSWSPVWNCPLSARRWPLSRHSAVYKSVAQSCLCRGARSWDMDLRHKQASPSLVFCLAYFNPIFISDQLWIGSGLAPPSPHPPPPPTNTHTHTHFKLALKDAGHRRPFKWWTFWLLEIQKPFW